MKRFKHYESYKDGSAALISQGIKDDLGRTIHEEIFEKESGKISRVKDTVYIDENNSCVITISHPDEITIDGHSGSKSIITEKYENFHCGIWIVYSSYATTYKDNYTEVENTIFEYDKYGVALLSCANTNPDEYSYKKFVKYINDDTDVVTILISNEFPIDQDETSLTEKDLGFGEEYIVYDKRIKKILSSYNHGFEVLHKYDFSVRGDKAYIETLTDNENDTIIREFNANGDIIKDKLIMKKSDGLVESRQYWTYEYDGRLLTRMTYNYEGSKLPQHVEEHPEKVIIESHYEYFDIVKEEK